MHFHSDRKAALFRCLAPRPVSGRPPIIDGGRRKFIGRPRNSKSSESFNRRSSE